MGWGVKERRATSSNFPREALESDGPRELSVQKLLNPSPEADCVL